MSLQLQPASEPIRLTAPFLGQHNRPYHPSEDLIAAANVALLLGAPLLLTGEPGCGKTDFAWAAAGALHRAESAAGRRALRMPLTCYVRSDTRARDLLYQYDALRRFGDAQLGREEDRSRAADCRRYVELQALGRALMSVERCVVLIDEIDKAPRDLPNDLLRELDQGHFEIPEVASENGPSAACFSHNIALSRSMTPPPGAKRPLVVITSNVERQLPDAFLRRCVFFHIRFPSEPVIEQILRDHFPPQPGPGEKELTPQAAAQHDQLLRDAVTVFCELRDGRHRLTKKPATAELLGWAYSLLTFQHDWDACARLYSLASAIRHQTAIAWDQVPALGCLLKMREDLDRIALRAA